MQGALNTPVAFIFFNRPEKTARVFEQIRLAQPRKLLLIADGCREDHWEDKSLTDTCRNIVDQVDWDCEVLKHYSETNLGCFGRLVSGCQWIFEQVDEVIVLEDDCLPHPDFFRFTAELLDRYRSDERIFMIGGRNSLWPDYTVPTSYTFSKSLSCWGWAGWQRSYDWFDPGFTGWRQLRETDWLENIFRHEGLVTFYRWRFDQCLERVEQGLSPSFAYTWVYAGLRHGGVEVMPARNLIHNMGFDDEATHPFEDNSPLANVPVDAMPFPLIHPRAIEWDSVFDALRYEQAAAKKVEILQQRLTA